jgi:hypothetical protein
MLRAPPRIAPPHAPPRLPSLFHFTHHLEGRKLQAKTDSQVRWAVLNTVLLLRAQRSAHEALAAAMQRGASVAECVRVIEECLDEKQLNTRSANDSKTERDESA